MKPPRHKRDETSAAITQSLWLIVGFSTLFVVAAYASNPSWWSSTGTGTQSAVICPPQVVTNSGIVTTNYVRNDYAVVTQGQLKHFTIRAVDYLNATLPAGAGSNLDTMVSNWAQDYLTNGYATNPANPTLPYKPSDLQAENVGQLKYIAGLVDAQLAVGGYTGLYPAWIVVNTNTDGAVANLGQLKEVFDFDLSAAPQAVTNLVATTSNPDEIDLSWTLPPMNNALSLSIEMSTDGGSTWTTVATGLDPTATSYAATGLSTSQNYEFEVSDGNSSGSSSSGSTTNTQPPPPLPPSPTGLTGTPTGYGGTYLTWTASTGATSYQIDLETLASGTWTNGYATTTTNSFFTWEDGYRYRVSAVNATGTSAPSNVYPQTRYAVIDMGVNMNPLALSNTGYVVSNSGVIGVYGFGDYQVGNFYRWANGTNQQLQPPYPDDDSWGVTGIDDQGNIAGSSWGAYTENDYSLTIVPLVWPSGSTAPIQLEYQAFGPYPTDNPVGAVYLTAMDYNGTIYGWDSEEDDVPTWVDDGYGVSQGVVWDNASGTDSLYPGASITITNSLTGSGYVQTGTTYQVNIAKNNQTIGVENIFDSTGSFVSSSNTVDGQVVSYQPVDINTVGDVLGYDFNSGLCFLSQNGVINALPLWIGAMNNPVINYATRIQHNADGSTTPADCPQIVYGIMTGLERSFICQYNPDTSAYEAVCLDALIPECSDWSGINATAINDNGCIIGTANLTTTTNVGGSPSTTTTNHGVMLIPAELAVDSDRNGTIVMANDANNPANAGLSVDTTSATKPFRFWVNDGQNTAEDKAALYGSSASPANDTLGNINYKADLENFARLWIYTGGLQSAIHSGAIKVALQWQNVTSGTPAINVYQAVETDGGTQYLNDDTTAGNQIAGSYGTAVAQVTGTSPVVLPTSLFTNLSSTNSKTYCLFEGTHAGAGELVMIFEDSTGHVIGQGGQVYMSLKTVTDMYEQAQVTPSGPTDIPVPFNFPANGSWSSSTATNDLTMPTIPTISFNPTTSSNFEHPADETKNCILYVHGWIVTPQRYVQQSSECFKRLWWGGYKGLFASLQWPSEESGASVSPNYVVDGPDYFDTEYRGFKYAQSAKQYTDSLSGQGYSVAVMAHSMGNIVASEALKEGANFQYLMMDAAVSARCYDTNPTWLSSTSVTFTTPDLSTSGGYGGYFSGLSGVNNAYNTLDDVLLHDWTSANALLKGKTQSTVLNYVYTGGTGVQLQYNLSIAHPSYYYRDVFANGVTNYHESMSMYARTETDAAGVGAIGGAVNTDINMQAYFPGSSAHSPQFDYNLSDNSGGTLQFYKDVITLFNFQ